MTVQLALYQPDIAQNTGTLLRLGACLGFKIHIIHPTGFPFSRQNLKRGALDYLELAHFCEHDSFDHFERSVRSEGRRLVLMTTKASYSAYDVSYTVDDVLLLGRESAGVPEDVAGRADLLVRIPMRPERRSLNVAIAGGLIVGEALRQTGHFSTLA